VILAKANPQEVAGATIGEGGRASYPPNRHADTGRTIRDTAVEMARPWKSQNDFHRRLEISPRPRDSHISTSRLLLCLLTDGERKNEKLDDVVNLSTESDQAQTRARDSLSAAGERQGVGRTVIVRTG